MPLAEPDYAIQRITDAHFRVHKFDGHHGCYLIGYNVKRRSDRWYCDCQAENKCKHITMVLKELNPKKELF